MELIQGHIYEAKRPRPVAQGFDRVYNDRQILYVDQNRVQYDSPSIGRGRHYPTINRADFEAWVGKDVTGQLPEGDWRAYKYR